MWVSSAEFYFQTQVQSASGLIPHPLILIFDQPNQLKLLDWSAVSFNYYYSPTLRITGGSDLVCLLSICPHSSLLFHLDFVAAVVFVAVFFAIVTIFGTNCLVRVHSLAVLAALYLLCSECKYLSTWLVLYKSKVMFQ